MPIENSSDHLIEIAAILAAGLLRLQGRKSSPNLSAASDSSLDCEGNSGGDVAGKVEISRP
jgi:hypothetical protein